MSSTEQPRIEAVEQYELGDVSHDPALDDIARLAAQICDAPVGVVSMVERDFVSILGGYGLKLDRLPRHTVPFDTTAQADGVYQIPDARRDPTYAPEGIAIGDQRYRFYAGASIQTPKGVALGRVCVLDTVARKLSPAQIDSLEALGHIATTRLELVAHVRETRRAARARQRVEEELTVEMNFVGAVLDTVAALVVVFDSAGRIVRFNRACEIISGYQAADVLGKYAWDRLIPKEDVRASVESFERIRQGNFPTSFENHWLASDGTRRRISWSATALLDTQGQVTFIIATGLDVTVQRVAEATIRESEARYRQIVEGSLGLVCTHDLEGRILSINEHGAQSFGRSISDVVGHRLTEFVYPERAQLIGPYFAALLATGEAQGLMHLQHSSGDPRVLAYRNRLVEPSDGPSYVLGFGIDITEQVRAEEQLRALIRQSNSVLESIGEGIYGTDLEGRTTVVNHAAAGMIGYRPEELLGQNMHKLIHHTRVDGTPYPEDECPIRSTLEHLNTVRVSNETFWRKDGTSFPVEYVARPQIESPSGDRGDDGGQRGRAVGVVVAFADISERNHLDRMKDEFISTVSHELRTPLTSLRAALKLIAGGSLEARPEKAQQMMEIAIDNTERLVRLVNDILDLESIGSGKAELHFSYCSITDLFERVLRELQETADDAKIRFVLESNDVTVWADQERIYQTLINLVSNAIKFSPHSGANPSEVKLSAALVNGTEALIEVEDHGRGIPSDKLQSIFERFKQVDASDSRAMGGTGLGLAICKSIVTQHGGQIWATSTLGEGATFHFTLPTRSRRSLRH